MDIEDKLKAIKSASGGSLYDHLLNTIGKLVQDHPSNAFEVFEEFSHYVKQNGYSYNDTKNFQDASRLCDDPQLLADHLIRISQYYGFELPQTDEEGGEPPESNPIGYVPDMMRQERMFRRAGISFGENQTYLLFNALKKFSLAKNATSVTFWGKIFGTQADYFVVEAVIDGADEQEIAEPHEAKGTGANTKTYYVCTNLIEGKWTELPLVMPRHIIQARRVKHTFTGDLSQAINSSPKFDGTEKEYLRAQIARIAHSTDIIHRFKYYVKPEDEQAEPNVQEIELVDEEEDNYRQLNGKDLANLENWVHYSPSLLKAGRCVHQELEDEDDDDVKTLKVQQQLALDPYEQRLKEISSDSYSGISQCWVLKQYGDFSQKMHLYQQKPTHDTLVSLRSLVWPGMTYIAQDQFTSFMYIGDGQKYSSDLYFHKFPYIIQNEPQHALVERDVRYHEAN